MSSSSYSGVNLVILSEDGRKSWMSSKCLSAYCEEKESLGGIMQTSDEEIQKLREHILAEIDLTREMSENTEIRAIVSEKCSIYGKQKILKLSEQEALEQYLFHSLRKLDVLQELLDDPNHRDYGKMGQSIFLRKRGHCLSQISILPSKEKLNDVIQQMAGSNNRMVNEASPIVDTRLANGSRVNIVLQPIAIDGSAISIRKFPWKRPFVMEDLIRFGAITEEATEFLKVLV